MPIVVNTVSPDDEQISACNVQAINHNKLKAYSASCWSCYTDVLQSMVNITLSPPIKYFPENRNKLDLSSTDQQLRMLLKLLQKHKGSNFCGHKILTACVFVKI
jgi:hypothetical protein